MSNKTKIVLLAVVALIIGIVIGAMFAPSSLNLGSVRTTTDQYIYGLDVIGPSTSTLKVKSNSPSKYGCIEMGNGTDSFYLSVTASGTATFEAGTCN